MKYDAPIDPTDPNSSHGIITQLVGTGKRVLDIGCSTGLLAEALGERGNHVWGVDIDPDVADSARPRLEKLVIGDMATLDLVEEFGTGSFDILVFADVLEHLTDPVEVLRNARRVLAQDGYVVVSIPNVAHASVRLALLRGHFDYRPVGLLDDTHLRFFTRSSLEDLFWGAGYFPAEIRRTRLGAFATEIPVRGEDFAPDLLEEVSRDPEAETYQFVVRAMPLGSSEADKALADEVIVKSQDLFRVSEELAQISRRLEATPMAPRLGLLFGGVPSALGRLRAASVQAEMVRRLPGFGFRSYALSDSPAPTGLTGDIAHPLLPWNPERSQRIAREVDAIVVVCSAASAADDRFRMVLVGLNRAGLPLHVVITDPSSNARNAEDRDHWWSRPSAVTHGPPTGRYEGLPSVVDPVALSGRLFVSSLLEQRLDYLEVLGKGPTVDRFVLVALTDLQPLEVASMWSALEAISRRSDADVVVIANGDLEGSPFSEASVDQSDGRRPVIFRDLEPIDLAALVAGAAQVVTDNPAFFAMASGMGRPVLAVAVDQVSAPKFSGWAATPARLVTDIDGLVAAAELSQGLALAESTDAPLGELELFLDDLADAVALSVGRRFIQSAPQRIDELVDQVNVLEAANAGLRKALAAERVALGARAHDLLAGRLDSAVAPFKTERVLHKADRLVVENAQKEAAQLRFELDAVYGTRTMRTVAPARRVYAKLRSLRR
jgi:SAM-dependent methyltransferase